MKAKEFINEIKKGQKDSNGFTRCWPGKHAVGTKKGKNGGQVRNCEPNESVEQGVAEGTEKRCMQCGMTNCSCKPGTCKCKPVAGWIPNKGFKKAIEEAMLAEKFDADQQFDIIEEMVEALAEAHGVDAEQIWEDFESVDDHELLDESAAWRRKAGKSKTGGLNKKGVASYRRENPGSKLQTAVTTKPSKLKPGSKAAKRRKSFCARMGGVDGPMKKPNGKPTRKALALRKWNC